MLASIDKGMDLEKNSDSDDVSEKVREISRIFPEHPYLGFRTSEQLKDFLIMDPDIWIKLQYFLREVDEKKSSSEIPDKLSQNKLDLYSFKTAINEYLSPYAIQNQNHLIGLLEQFIGYNSIQGKKIELYKQDLRNAVMKIDTKEINPFNSSEKIKTNDGLYIVVVEMRQKEASLIGYIHVYRYLPTLKYWIHI